MDHSNFIIIGIQVNGKIMNNMEKEYIYGHLVKYMKVIGLMVKEKVTVSTEII